MKPFLQNVDRLHLLCFVSSDLDSYTVVQKSNLGKELLKSLILIRRQYDDDDVDDNDDDDVDNDDDDNDRIIMSEGKKLSMSRN